MVARDIADNAIAMAEEIMIEKTSESVGKSTIVEVKKEPVAVVQCHFQVPEFLSSILHTVQYRRRDRDYVRCPRYPNEIVMLCIDLMVRI